jgi:hypothetical protein
LADKNFRKEKRMTKRILSISLSFILPLIALTSLSQPLPEKRGETPVIYFDKISYTFPPLFQGEDLSHTFTVSNRGTANLDLKKVTHS